MQKQNEYYFTKHGGPKERTWVIIGGSYPGALVAWFKNTLQPKKTIAWSSSGVINAIKDFTNFDLDIYEATSKSGAFCPESIQKIVAYVDKIFDEHDKGKS